MYVRDKFLKKLILTLKQHPCLLQGRRILLMVSGGVDSMVLLTAVGMIKDAPLLEDMEFGVFTVDHGVRPESADEVEHVCRVASNYSFVCHKVKLSPTDTDETSLRRLRLDALKDVMQRYGYDMAWTAHHADDVVETVVVQMLRGSDIRGVVSLRWCSEALGHPFLGFWRNEIEDFARRHDIEFFVDKTNEDISIPRNFVRHRLIPVMEQVLAGKRGVYLFWEKSADAVLALNSLLDEVWEKHVKIPRKGEVEFVDCSVEVCVELLKRWLRLKGLRPPGWLVEKVRFGKGSYRWAGYRFLWSDGKLLVKEEMNRGESIDRQRRTSEPD